MKSKFILFAAALLASSALSFGQQKDWANFSRYEQANQTITKNPTVVFMGNSITEGWQNAHPEFFKENNYVGRGISGQVTSQMLVRFRADVINLKPKAVVILAGTNDIAQNNGFIKVEHIFENMVSMAELAKANKIKVVICSVLPAAVYSWHKEIDPIQPISELNSMLKEYAKKNKIAYADYFSVMVDERQGLEKKYQNDEVHPNKAGYVVMEEVIQKVLKKVLR
ncbi:MAG: SGNH/GDSL hydrolase family protein [Bacteroidales bacterium]|nr:SGNH/GDSL hydrolase family protein [Bacteroidales bacterium]MDD4823140.1 SGNH/GDSL hydrolase family protein [Bacteroidales bacterium]